MEGERGEVNMHIKQHRYMERESEHEQTHTSQPTPFHTHPTSYAHTTHGPTELLLPVLPDGRVKLSSSQHPNTATLSHTRRESVHRVTNKTRASRGMSPNLPKSSPLVPKAESDHFGFKKCTGKWFRHHGTSGELGSRRGLILLLRGHHTRNRAIPGNYIANSGFKWSGLERASAHSVKM